MLRAALRNLFAHKLRLGLTALSIVLAVAFVAGTYIFTDSLRASLDTLIQQNQPDVTVQPTAADFTSDFQGGGQTPTVPTDLGDQIRQLPGVTSVIPQIQVTNVVVLDGQGKPLGAEAGGFGSGTVIGQTWTPPEVNPSEIIDGRAPSAADEIALDTGTVDQLEVVVGDAVTILLPSGDRQEFALTGTTRLRGSGFGVGFATWDFDTAQELFLKPGQATSLAVLAQPSVSQGAVRDEIVPLLPPGRRRSPVTSRPVRSPSNSTPGSDFSIRSYSCSRSFRYSWPRSSSTTPSRCWSLSAPVSSPYCVPLGRPVHRSCDRSWRRLQRWPCWQVSSGSVWVPG